MCLVFISPLFGNQMFHYLIESRYYIIFNDSNLIVMYQSFKDKLNYLLLKKVQFEKIKTFKIVVIE